MARILKRESAVRDLTEQWVWYAESADVDLADRFFVAVQETLEILAEHPEAGRRFPTAHPSLARMRQFPVGGEFDAIQFFYLPLEDGIDLVRVVHGRRDLKTLFGDTESQ